MIDDDTAGRRTPHAERRQALDRDLDTVRTGRARPGARRAPQGRVLRHPDAAQPDGDDQRAGAAPDHDPAVGSRRSSAPSRRRSRSRTWASTPTNDGNIIRLVDPAAHRRSPQGAGRRSCTRRSRKRRVAVRNVRRDCLDDLRKRSARQADLGRRRARAQDAAAEDHRQVRRRSRPARPRRRSKSCWRSDRAA